MELHCEYNVEKFGGQSAAPSKSLKFISLLDGWMKGPGCIGEIIPATCGPLRCHLKATIRSVGRTVQCVSGLATLGRIAEFGKACRVGGKKHGDAL